MPTTSWESYFSGNTVSDIPQSMAPAARHPQNIYLTTHRTHSQVLFLKSVLWTDVQFGQKCTKVLH